MFTLPRVPGLLNTRAWCTPHLSQLEPGSVPLIHLNWSLVVYPSSVSTGAWWCTPHPSQHVPALLFRTHPRPFALSQSQLVKPSPFGLLRLRTWRFFTFLSHPGFSLSGKVDDCPPDSIFLQNMIICHQKCQLRVSHYHLPYSSNFLTGLPSAQKSCFSS